MEYVDGSGVLRHARDDADDPLDREAIFAFRGGGGVGIATSLELDLVPVTDLHAGYLLWPVEHLASVVGAWAATIGSVGDDVVTSISVLHAPPGPPFPEELQGRPLVHLAVAAQGASGAQPLLAAVRAAATPTVDTWGPADVAKLGQIHLDPPVATPAIGDARWLTGAAPDRAADILATAAAPDSAVVMLEIRSTGDAVPARDGARTSVGGPFLVHGVGALTDADRRTSIDQGLARVREAARSVDAGSSVGSWVEGATSVPDALPEEVRARVAAAADAVDPAGVVWRYRFLT